MPECDQDHRRVPLAVPIGLRGPHQSFDLELVQIFARSQFGIRDAPRWHCPINSAGRHQPQIAFTHVKSPSVLIDVSLHRSFLGQ
jgi:hypothetical protein